MKSCLKDDGFTLVEILFALGLFSLLSVFMTSALASITDWHVKDTNTNTRMEWNIFIRQLEREFQKTKDFGVPKSNVLLLDKSGEEITYEVYNNMVRRRVDGAGHEMVLQDIKSFHVKKEGESLIISVTLINGDMYEKRLFKRYKFEPS
ncbi:competence type IV pilus minor pilin ComGF [Bacillus sp. D386]|uniref:competence type IV pilus minor pilin ComGF n=1 Tax=Bacillus sp. D386 TaxID=2587155 RepID=UPI00111E3D5B